MYTVAEAAEYLGLAKITVNKHIESGNLKAERLGTMGYIIKRRDLEAFQQSKAKPGRPSGKTPSTP